MTLNLVLHIVALVLAVVVAIWQRLSYPTILLAVAIALIALANILRPTMIIG